MIHGFADDVIRKRRQELIDGANKVNNNEDGGVAAEAAAAADDELGIRKNKSRALLDILLQSTIDGKPLSDEDIRDEVNTFMFGVRNLFRIFPMHRHFP